jgi:hypothetical protein
MSATLSTLLELLKYTLPAVVVLIATYLIVDKFLTNDTTRKQLAILGENAKHSIQMRMQAYERLILFVERMDVQQLIGRFYNSEASVQDLQLAFTQSIRAEYEYNMSQQLYISKEAWQTVTAAKEQEISMINQIATEFALGTPAKAYVQRLTEIAVGQEDDTPRQIASIVLNAEAKKLLIANS